VEHFARQGSRVAFIDVDRAHGEPLCEELADARHRPLFLPCDVTDLDALGAAIAKARAALGPIGVLVNNAAVTTRGRFLERSADEFAAEIDVTVTGTVRISHAVAARMADHGGGAIVSLMGDSGRVGESGLAVTATARSSTLGLTKSLAKELARHGIRANAVSLGLVQTDRFSEHAGGTDDERLRKITALYPLRRLGRPEDVTPTILLLASPLSSWTTGQVLSVNGGFAMP
jgi:3-oxoacyl-[acyl-carrier protein] reductase